MSVPTIINHVLLLLLVPLLVQSIPEHTRLYNLPDSCTTQIRTLCTLCAQLPHTSGPCKLSCMDTTSQACTDCKVDTLAECHECERDNIDALAEAGCTHVDCPKRVMSLCPVCKDTPLDRCTRRCRGEAVDSDACADCKVLNSRCSSCVTLNESGLTDVCAWVKGDVK